MSLEEKIGQMVQLPITSMLTSGRLDPAKARGAVLDSHIGSFLSIAGEDTQTLQRIAVQEGRLGIPALFGMDAIHGHALYQGATVFPMPLALSCSWNPELLERVAEATAKECRATGVRWTFSPILDVARDPRWGRVVEGFGEDSFLVSELGSSMVRGYQGEDLSEAGRILRAKLELGLFDDPYDAIRPEGLNTPEHRALALEAARESLVLLKNKGILPLRSSKRIAVIGPLADAAQDQLRQTRLSFLGP